jgi:hypothetical protein
MLVAAVGNEAVLFILMKAIGDRFKAIVGGQK